MQEIVVVAPETEVPVTVSIITRRRRMPEEPRPTDMVAWRRVNGSPPEEVFRSKISPSTWLTRNELEIETAMLKRSTLVFESQGSLRPVVSPVEDQEGWRSSMPGHRRFRVRYYGGTWVPYPSSVRLDLIVTHNID